MHSRVEAPCHLRDMMHAGRRSDGGRGGGGCQVELALALKSGGRF